MRILFAGTSAIGEKVAEVLLKEQEVVGLLTQPDRPVGRHQKIEAPPIKKLFQQLAPTIPILQPERLRDPAVIAWVENLNPDIIVTISYGKIVPPEILELPRIACLNIHASLLPHYRGASPIQTAIMNGDQETGITIMYMAEGLDTGDILLTKKLSLNPQETAGSLTQRLATLAPEALREALHLIEIGEAPRIPQVEHLSTHTHRLERADAHLDWSRPAVELERLIRAMNPKPGAHGVITLSSGKSLSLKVFSAEVRSLKTGELPKPGSFFLTEEKETVLVCGKEALLFQEVQPEGRGRMHFADFLRGLKNG